MGLERRSRADQDQPEANPSGDEPRAGSEPVVKSFEIDKRLIYRAWEKVRANKGAPGVDAVSIGTFEEQLRANLYKLWNRMSSGSYFPDPVRGVEIPKDHGAGVRLLGVPNVADRVAQTAAAMLLERELEPVFRAGPVPSAVLEEGLGAGSGCPRLFRFRSARPDDEGGGSPHQRAVGPAVHLAVACRAGADAGRDHYAKG